MSLSKVQNNTFTPSINAKVSSPQSSLQQKIQSHSFSSLSWKMRSIEQIDKWDARLEEMMPNFFLQKKIDEWAMCIESHFSPFYEFNMWLNSNGEGNWTMQLATFLAKLPIRSARNIFQLFYQMIQTSLYTVVHPLKSVNHIAKSLILIIDELEKPETWTQMGAGTAGTFIGQAWITGTPFSVIGIGIGAAMVLTGLSTACLRASLKEQKGLQKLKSQSIKLPEAFLTGTLMGVLIGAIQKKLNKKPSEKAQENQVSNSSSLMEHEIIDRFIKENNLPPYSKLIVNPNGNLTILWDSQKALQYFGEKHPGLFLRAKQYSPEFHPLDVTISLSDPTPRMDLHYSYKVYTYDGNDPWIYTTTDSRAKWLTKYLFNKNSEVPAP